MAEAPLRRAAPPDSRLAVFAVAWALAALWHLLGNPRYGSGWSEALLVGAVAVVLARPGGVGPLVALAVASLVAIWEEAPVVGNHWVLAGFVNLALLVSVVRSRWPAQHDPRAVADRFVPAARLCLVAAYSFAAFSKLNTGFLDPDVSCAVYYFRETTDSVGLSALQLGDAAWLRSTVILATLAVELSVPVLLVIRRTRYLGVVVALLFHGVLALDRINHVFDFSSVLLPLFLLFLPAAFFEWVVEVMRSTRARVARTGDRAPHLLHGLMVALPTAAGLAVAGELVDPDQAVAIGWWPWQPWALLWLLLVLRFLERRPERPRPGSLRVRQVSLLVVPLLVVANGFTPYLELKTSFGWNMYSNLRTASGESNHLLVARTLPLSDAQDHLVEVLDSSDAGLAAYHDQGYALTWRALRTYLSEHPDVRVTYRRHGEVVSLGRASDRPELVRPVPMWRDKLQAFRPVDLRDPVRCVPAFGPAR